MSDQLPLYVNEKELAARIGVGEDKWRSIRPFLTSAGFPSVDSVTGLRYWPKVKAFLDRYNGLDAVHVVTPTRRRASDTENMDAFTKNPGGRRRRPE